MTNSNRARILALAFALIAAPAFAGDQAVAPAGDCAEPRGLARGGDPEDFTAAMTPPTGQRTATAPTPTAPDGLGLRSDPVIPTFDIAGPPSDRLIPAQVAAGMSLPGGAGAPAPPAPPSPAVSLCDSPSGCGAAGPAFVEAPTVPSLPPGLP